MIDPQSISDGDVEERQAIEQPELSADGLRTAMYYAVERKRSAAIAALDAQEVEKARRENLSFVETMAVDAWLGAMGEEQAKKLYGTNDTDRKRNSNKMLAGNEAVAAERHALVEAERAAAIAQISLDSAAERVQNLRSVAWAYGGECLRGFEPVEDKAAKRDRGIPAELAAGRGLKLVRDTAGVGTWSSRRSA